MPDDIESIMKKYFLITAISFILFISCGDETQQQMGLPEIPVYKTEIQRIPIYQEFVGEVYGVKDITIRARVAGYLEEIYGDINEFKNLEYYVDTDDLIDEAIDIDGEAHTIASYDGNEENYGDLSYFRRN